MPSTVYKHTPISCSTSFYLCRPSLHRTHAVHIYLLFASLVLLLVDRRKLVRFSPHSPLILLTHRRLPFLHPLPFRPHLGLVRRPNFFVALIGQHRTAEQTTRRPLHQHRKHHLARHKVRPELKDIGAVHVGHRIVDSGDDGLQEAEYAANDEKGPGDDEDPEHGGDGAGVGAAPAYGVWLAVCGGHAEEGG